MSPIRVIIVTDGDVCAQAALARATFELGLYFLSTSGGNPTRLSGSEIIKQIIEAPYDPVVVMADDKGQRGMGPGEMVMEHIFKCPRLTVIGVVAVASDTRVRGIVPDASVTADGRIIKGPVNKDGWEEKPGNQRLEGDTVEILKKYPELFILGCGDLGKMNGRDAVENGAMITRLCLEEILARHKNCIK
ncbi:MAG: stage V sporulation protein AE [Syntrophomonadaceae bacterium]